MQEEFIFVSYCHSDFDKVKKIADNITQLGYNIAIDETSMFAGEDWEIRAKRMIRNPLCKFVIVFQSDNAIISSAILKEMNYVKGYGKNYCTIILDHGSIQEKFIKINSRFDISEEIKDVADEMRSFFPDNILFINNDEQTLDKIDKTLVHHGVGKTKSVFNDEQEKSSEVSIVEERKSQFIIISGDKVTIDDINDALRLDRMVYKIDDSEQFTIEKCMNWFNTNNKIYTMLKDTSTNHIVAYINASPITDDVYEDMLIGKYSDANIEDSAIVPYDMPGLYNLYFASVVVDPNYQNIGILKQVYDAMVDVFINLSNNDIIIERMVADAISEKGKRFCELFGMKQVNPKTNHSSAIYEVKMLPPCFRVSSQATKKLFNLYSEKSKIITS